MSSKTNYTENKVLDHIFGGTVFAPLANLFFGLLTAAPTDTTPGTEVSGTSYARAQVPNNPTNFPAAVDGVKQNGVAIIWPTAPVDWGTAVAVGIYDAPSGGNLLFYAPITPRVIQANDTLNIPIGALEISEN